LGREREVAITILTKSLIMHQKDELAGGVMVQPRHAPLGELAMLVDTF